MAAAPHLFLDGVAALLRDVDEVEHAALEVGQRRHGLHLDRVALLQGVVQNTRGVNHLVKRCGCKGHRPRARARTHTHKLKNQTSTDSTVRQKDAQDACFGRCRDADAMTAVSVMRFPSLSFAVCKLSRAFAAAPLPLFSPPITTLHFHRSPALNADLASRRTNPHTTPRPPSSWRAVPKKHAHLPTKVAVVHVPHVQGLGGEGVRLDVHLRPRHLQVKGWGGGDEGRGRGHVKTPHVWIKKLITSRLGNHSHDLHD